MARSRLTQRFKLYDWNKFSKDFKKKYKEENGEALTQNTAMYLTFSKIQRLSIISNKITGLKDPEIEDVVTLIKLGNNNCKDEQAIEILENYLDDESVTGGLLGAFLDIIVDFYTDLKLGTKFTKTAIDIRDAYIEGLKKSEETDTKNEMTDKTDEATENNKNNA